MKNVPSQNAEGALSLLDREPPEEYLREWTARVAEEQMVVEAGTRSIVVFRIGIEWLALPTPVFQEVAENCVLHTVPHRRATLLKGLINVRGELLLCASLAALLGLVQPPLEKKERTRVVLPRLLVVNRHGNRLAFPVDEVQSVLRYNPRDLRNAPSTLVNSAAPFTLGLLPWQNRTVGCLDEELLFYQLDKSFA